MVNSFHKRMNVGEVFNQQEGMDFIWKTGCLYVDFSDI